LIATDSRGQGRVYFDFQEQVNGVFSSVDFVYKNNVSESDELLKFDQKSWLASGDLFMKGSESIIAGGVRGGLQLFENMSIGNGGNGGSKLVVSIFPNPVNVQTGLTIETNQSARMEVISLLGQSIIESFEVNKYTTSVLDVGHLRNGTYILRSESDSGVTSSKLFLIMR